MLAPWTHLRRLVVSVMLAAMVSLVLHGSAAAGLLASGSDGAGCAKRSVAGHVHHASRHGHHDAAHARPLGHHGHGLAHGDFLDADGADGAMTADLAGDDEEAPCCGSVCAVAVAALAPADICAPVAVAATLIPASQQGSGIGLNGLKRPPRTVAVA